MRFHTLVVGFFGFFRCNACGFKGDLAATIHHAVKMQVEVPA